MPSRRLENPLAVEAPPVPYVKLFDKGLEIKMPTSLFLTATSEELLKKGSDGQGYIYFLDLETGAIHLLAANNPNETVDLSGLDAKAQLAARQALIEKNIPMDRFNKPFKGGEYAITMREKTVSTGGMGGGDLHRNGANVLGLRNKKLLAGGFWIKRQEDQLGFEEFRTRSTENLQTVAFNPIHKFLFTRSLEQGHEVGHDQVYNREIPMLYLRPIIDVFLQATHKINTESPGEKKTQTWMAAVNKSLSLDYSDGDESAIPESTLLHLDLESDLDPETIMDDIYGTIEYKGELSTLEADVLLKAFFDPRFPENLSLLSSVINSIEEDFDMPVSKQLAALLHSYLGNMDSLHQLFLPSMSLPDASLLLYAIEHNHIEAVQYFIQHPLLSKCPLGELHRVYKLLEAKGQFELIQALPDLEKIKQAPENNFKTALEALNRADANHNENEIKKWCEVFRLENQEEVFKPFVEKHCTQGNDCFSKAQNANKAEEKSVNGYEQALTEYNLALLFDPKHVPALMGQAQVYYALGEYVKAQECCGKARVFEPDLRESKPEYKTLLDAVHIQSLKSIFLNAHKELLKEPAGDFALFFRLELDTVINKLGEIAKSQSELAPKQSVQQQLLKQIHWAMLSHAIKARQSSGLTQKEHEKLVEAMNAGLKTLNASIAWTGLEKIKKDLLSTSWNIPEGAGKTIVIDEFGTSLRVPAGVATLWGIMQQVDENEEEILHQIQTSVKMKLGKKELTFFDSSQFAQEQAFYRQLESDSGPQIRPKMNNS